MITNYSTKLKVRVTKRLQSKKASSRIRLWAWKYEAGVIQNLK
jgi:hypothetical protein